MKILWLSTILPLVFVQAQFGTSHLGNSRLCLQWSCLNDNLGLQDSLPPKETYTQILQGLLPEGPWQDAVAPVLDVCYGRRPRTYSSSCPGQALMHCVVEQLIQKCPDENWRKKDACAPVSAFVGAQYMFSQSRYNNIEENLPLDRRPAWFLTNYFNVRCCDLPPLFNDTLLHQCGLKSVMHYFQLHTQTRAPTHSFKIEKTQTEDGLAVQVVPFNDIQPTTSSSVEDDGEYDPLDCCDMHEFIAPAWRSDCEFELSWNTKSRLTIKNTTGSDTITTTEIPKSLRTKDVKMVPYSGAGQPQQHPLHDCVSTGLPVPESLLRHIQWNGEQLIQCEQNHCIFKALGIVSESGIVNIDAFSKLLDNLTDKHPAWVRAKGRVLTTCLGRPLRSYEYDCQINNVLACTFDVLSENCPNTITPDPCRHSGASQDEVICQISSSKLRPRNRRQFCGLPNLVNHEILSQCNLNSLIDLEYVPETVIKPRQLLSTVSCNDSTPATLCLMEKMGVLNKYNFMDYFRMRDRIRTHSYGEWYPFKNIFIAAFNNVDHYKEHCSSPKKLLNVIDAMLTYCPHSKRRISPQCSRLFSKLNSDYIRNRTQNEQLFNTFGHVFTNHLDIGQVRKTWTHTNPLFDFGMFGSENAPPVRTIDLRVKTEKPLVLLPVYQRMPFKLNKDQILRGGPVTPN